MKRTATVLILGLPLGLGGCGYGASKMAHQAQISMIGMSEADLQACAGPADKTIALNDKAHILNYVYKPSATGGFTLDLPLSLGGVSLGGSGTYCSMNVRIVDHKVTELHYTGDDDKSIGNDGVCTAMVRGCMRQPEPTMGPLDDKASGFHSPSVPPQTTQAETITDSKK